MKRMINVLLLLLVLLGTSKVSLGGAAQEQQGTEGTTIGLSEDEKEILGEAVKPDATEAEKARAEDICSEKCKVCHDGISCDLDCARRTCLKNENDNGQ